MAQGLTYQPSKISRIRRFGFRARNANHWGKLVLQRRRTKMRKRLSASNEFGTTKMEKDKKFSRRR